MIRPTWLDGNTTVNAAQLTDGDYQYLARWVDQHAKTPQDYLLGLFQAHQVVIVGEFHHVREHKEVVSRLIPQLYHDAGVRCIGWEFSRYADNDRLSGLTTGAAFDRGGALDFARDQAAHEWDSKEHWDFIEAVWRLNNSLSPGREPMRLIGLSCDLYRLVRELKATDPGSPAFSELAQRHDMTMVESVEKEIMAANAKAVLFVGRCHDFTHYEFTPNQNFGRPIMANVLHRKYGDKVFQVWLESGFLPAVEKTMALRGGQPVGFDLYASPFANILSPPNWDAPEVPLSNLARGCVYLGPRSSLHKNTPIEGFVTEEMFGKYKAFYEADFGRAFDSAEEVDKYFGEKRFPSP